MDDDAARRTPNPPGSGPGGDRAVVRALRAARVGARRRLRALVLRPGALTLLVFASATALAAALAANTAP